MIDVKDLSVYRANNRLIQLSPSTIKHQSFWPEGACVPYKGPWKNAYKELLWMVEFKGTREEIERNKSKLFQDLLSAAALKDGPFEYHGTFISEGVAEQYRGFEVVNYKGLVLHLGAQKSQAVSTTKTIANDGTALSPVRLQLTGGPGNLTINEVSLGKLSPGTGGLIIDTMTGEIKTNAGASGIHLAEIIELPKLQPGSNTITLTGGLAGTLTYWPVYL
jgi:hypothetical protein